MFAKSITIILVSSPFIVLLLAILVTVLGGIQALVAFTLLVLVILCCVRMSISIYEQLKE